MNTIALVIAASLALDTPPQICAWPFNGAQMIVNRMPYNDVVKVCGQSEDVRDGTFVYAFSCATRWNFAGHWNCLVRLPYLGANWSADEDRQAFAYEIANCNCGRWDFPLTSSSGGQW